MYAGTHCGKENRRPETGVLATARQEINGIRPRYALGVENCLSYVCHRTVYLGRKSYKYTVDGGVSSV